MNPFDEHLVRYRKEGIKYLRTNVPEIQKLESLDDLQDLNLVGQKDFGGIVLILQYKATAPSLFPAVRQRLLDKNVVKRHNILHTSIKNKGTPEELCNVTMRFYGSKLQISLDVHK